MTNTRILCVDDDEKILSGIRRQQSDNFDIETAVGPHAALKMIAEEEPYAVVLSDMRMPDMNGVELLAQVREASPDTVRMILTGYAELDTTIGAVNQGHIFRFLSKPCDEDVLADAFRAGLRQYSLVQAEKELVEGTLRGCVKVLSDVLSLINPLAFGQSIRVRAIVDALLKRVSVEHQWQLEIAAMLSALGCVTLPVDLLEKKLNGDELSDEEAQTFSEHPAIAGELIRGIPRLDVVAEIIASQRTEASAESPIDPNMSIESRILNLAVNFDLLELNAESSLHALAELKKSPELYGTDLLDPFTDFIKTERNLEFAELMLFEIHEGMVLAQDIKTSNGLLLMSKGQEITKSASRLLENYRANKAIEEPIKVVISQQKTAVAAK